MKKVPYVILWAIAFAYVESAVVEYLRALYHPLEAGGFKFPLPTQADLESMGPGHMTRLAVEFGREICTLVMLATVGLLAADNRREAWGHFLIVFGVWDIFYYVWLKEFLDWPPSIVTWDLLFLVPVPWVGPVLAPVIISVTMIAAGLTVLYHEGRGRALITTGRDWVLLVSGGVTVIASFCLDYSNIMNSGVPAPFNWYLFSSGLLLSLISFTWLVRRNLSDGRRST